MSTYYESIEAIRAASALEQSRGNCCICGGMHNLPNKAKGYVSSNKCQKSMANLAYSLNQFQNNFRRVFQEIVETIVKKNSIAQKLYNMAGANGLLVYVDYKNMQDRVSTNTELSFWWDMMCMPFVKPTVIIKEIENILDETCQRDRTFITISHATLERLSSNDFWQEVMTIFNDLLKSQKYREAMGLAVKAIINEEDSGLYKLRKNCYPLTITYPVISMYRNSSGNRGYYTCDNFLYMLDAIKQAGLNPDDYTSIKRRYPVSLIKIKQYNVTDTGHDVLIYLPDKSCSIRYFCTFNGEITNLCVS